jgi:hypothetical protein
VVEASNRVGVEKEERVALVRSEAVEDELEAGAGDEGDVADDLECVVDRGRCCSARRRCESERSRLTAADLAGLARDPGPSSRPPENAGPHQRPGEDGMTLLGQPRREQVDQYTIKLLVGVAAFSSRTSSSGWRG